MRKASILIFVLLAFTAVSCVKDRLEPKAGKDDVTIEVVASSPRGDVDAKSRVPEGLQNVITDVNMFVFRNGQLVSAVYSPKNSGISGRSLFMNDDLGTTFNDHFNVYILSNVGNQTSDSQFRNEAGIENAIYNYGDSFENFFQKGFPMASIYYDYCPVTDSRSLKANKLVTQYNIRIKQKLSNKNHYRIKSAYIMDEAKRIKPFAESYKETDKYDGIKHYADTLSVQDIANMNTKSVVGSDSVSLAATCFILENMQGDSFIDKVNCDSLKKKENLTTEHKDLCTYIEMNVEVKTPTATYDNVVYRYYFGDNCRDCSVRRNIVYNLDLDFTNIYVEDEGWRIEPGKPNVDENALVLQTDKLSIVKGMPLRMKVTKKDMVDYSVTYDAKTASNYGITLDFNSDSTYVTFSTTYNTGARANVNNLSVNYVDIPFLFKTKDNNVIKPFTLRVITSAIPVEVTFNRSSDNLTMTLPKCLSTDYATDNVSKLIKWTLDVKVFATNVWRNNAAINKWSCEVLCNGFDIQDDEAIANATFEDIAGSSMQTFTIDNLGEAAPLSKCCSELNGESNAKTHKINAIGRTESHYPVPDAYSITLSVGSTGGIIFSNSQTNIQTDQLMPVNYHCCGNEYATELNPLGIFGRITNTIGISGAYYSELTDFQYSPSTYLSRDYFVFRTPTTYPLAGGTNSEQTTYYESELAYNNNSPVTWKYATFNYNIYDSTTAGVRGYDNIYFNGTNWEDLLDVYFWRRIGIRSSFVFSNEQKSNTASRYAFYKKRDTNIRQGEGWVN